MVRFERRDDTDGDGTDRDEDAAPAPATVTSVAPHASGLHEADDDVGVDSTAVLEEDGGRWSPIEPDATSALAVEQSETTL